MQVALPHRCDTVRDIVGTSREKDSVDMYNYFRFLERVESLTGNEKSVE